VRIIPAILVLAMVLHAIPLRGVVLDEASDSPIPYANINYVSGKTLGQSDSRGRFEFDLESSRAILVFKKNGYDSLLVELQDYTDLLDVVVNMRSDARHLGSATVVGGGAVSWENPKTISVQKLEDAAGLRFDLTDHLSQMPGMSGQADFSGNLFYDGSRAEEVAYHFGELRVPNMRHLDIGFPGNLSVINPHAIESININEHYGTNPFNQGIAGSVQFVPRNVDEFKTDISLGTTLREIYMEGPWLFWDGFAFSARYLDPSMLQNMGEKFFTEFKRNTDEPTGDSFKAFSLSAMDIYARFFGKDSSHNSWAVAALYASDEYAVNQRMKSRTVPIIQGSQIYSLASAEYKTLEGTNVFVGVVSEETSNTLRDTLDFRRLENLDDMANHFIDGYEKTRLTASAGVSWEQTENLGFALLYDFRDVNRKWTDFGTQKATLNDNVFQASTYYKTENNGLQSAIGAGGIFSLSEKQILPLASFDIEKSKKNGVSVFGNAAWRSDWNDVLDGNEIKGELKGGASLKAGASATMRGLKVSAHSFGRYYRDPTLPIPKAFEHYKETQDVDFAWVYGTQITFDFHSMHSIALQSNLAHVYGEYNLPQSRTLPWQANSRMDMVSHLRVYPLSDSTISFILSHRAAFDRPLYEWRISQSHNTESGQVQGTRSIMLSDKTTSLFRTDVRVNLDLKSRVKVFLLENIRFFAEVNNIFAPLDVEALRFLGGDNHRERSVAVRDNNEDSRDGFDIVPFMAQGMGYYIQFGVEGSFGL